MLKTTTKQLYELKKEINGGKIKAAIYFEDEKGIPNFPCAWARDIHGVERVLVIWTERKMTDETPFLISRTLFMNWDVIMEGDCEEILRQAGYKDIDKLIYETPVVTIVRVSASSRNNAREVISSLGLTVKNVFLH